MVFPALDQACQGARTFLYTEIKIGHSFAKMASRSKYDRKRSDRQRKAARKAYDAVEHLLPQVPLLPQTDVQQLKRELETLKEKLKKLGEKF